MKNRSKTFDQELSLIDVSYTHDEYDRPIKQETSRNVLCKELSVGSNEVYQARQQDIFVVKKFAIHSMEYLGEKIVEFNGTRYKVVRVYGTDLVETELTVEEIRNG